MAARLLPGRTSCPRLLTRNSHSGKPASRRGIVYAGVHRFCTAHRSGVRGRLPEAEHARGSALWTQLEHE